MNIKDKKFCNEYLFFSVLVIVLLPGLKHHGILHKYFSTALKTVASLMKSSVSAVQGGGGGGSSSVNGEASKKKE